MRQPWKKAGQEPALADVFADPIVQSLMRADRLSRGDVLRATQARCDRPQRQSDDVPLSV